MLLLQIGQSGLKFLTHNKSVSSELRHAFGKCTFILI